MLLSFGLKDDIHKYWLWKFVCNCFKMSLNWTWYTQPNVSTTFVNANYMALNHNLINVNYLALNHNQRHCINSLLWHYLFNSNTININYVGIKKNKEKTNTHTHTPPHPTHNNTPHTPHTHPHPPPPPHTHTPTHLKTEVVILPHVFFTLTDWPWLLRHRFCHFDSRLLLIFSPGARISVWHWGWGCHESTSENENWYTKN